MASERLLCSAGSFPTGLVVRPRLPTLPTQCYRTIGISVEGAMSPLWEAKRSRISLDILWACESRNVVLPSPAAAIQWRNLLGGQQCPEGSSRLGGAISRLGAPVVRLGLSRFNAIALQPEHLMKPTPDQVFSRTRREVKRPSLYCTILAGSSQNQPSAACLHTKTPRLDQSGCTTAIIWGV